MAAGAFAITFVGALSLASTGAQAVMVDMNPAAHGKTTVTYPTDQGSYYGVALIPTAREEGSSTTSYLAAAGIPVVIGNGACADPAASSEPDILGAGSWPLTAPAKPICWHNGPVMHSNETFTLEWEGQAPNTYWSGTKSFVQSFLGDVAAASGQLVNPYSDTTQYWDGSSAQNRAAYSSLFGGGCDDNGTASCKFGSVTGSGAGNALPTTSSCPVTGDNIWAGTSGGGVPQTISNNVCVTDSDIQHEVTSLIDNDGLIRYTKSGYTPLVNVMTPPGVVVCLDALGNLCSANGRVAPPPPSLSSAAPVAPATASIPAGTYSVVVTYLMTGGGESLPSAPTKITTSGATSTITITAPPAHSGVSGWDVYVAQPGSTSFTRQGSSTPGQDITLSSLSGSGPTPPTQPASFCSYHGQVLDPQSGKLVSYVVQPWTAFTNCDEPDVGTLPTGTFLPQQVEKLAGQALVSPLSQAQAAALVNPQLNGWFGQDGLEINDQNNCRPLDQGLDSYSFGNSGQGPYILQRESNNQAVVDSDLYTYNGCLPWDVLTPAFVAPSAINLGDTIDLDGSATATSLGVPNANFKWTFGDGAVGNGPSVEHTYASAGNYTVKLTVTDRGGNQASVTQVVQVLGSAGLPVPPPSTPGTGKSQSLTVRLQLLPQGLHTVLSRGIAVRVNSSEPANGFATISISRKQARRARIAARRALVVIGTGTVWQVKDGTVTLNLRLSSSIIKKLRHMKHVTLSIRLALVDSAGHRVAVDVAGTY